MLTELGDLGSHKAGRKISTVEGPGSISPPIVKIVESSCDLFFMAFRVKNYLKLLCLNVFQSDGDSAPDTSNKRALKIVRRVREKLTGRDFAAEDVVDVPKQVQLLIEQATSHENLCQCYIGW